MKIRNEVTFLVSKIYPLQDKVNMRSCQRLFIFGWLLNSFQTLEIPKYIYEFQKDHMKKERCWAVYKLWYRLPWGQSEKANMILSCTKFDLKWLSHYLNTRTWNCWQTLFTLPKPWIWKAKRKHVCFVQIPYITDIMNCETSDYRFSTDINGF